MRRELVWVVVLGISAVAPGGVSAGPLSIFRSRPPGSSSASNSKRPTASSSSKLSNQEVANRLAAAMRAARLSGYDIRIGYSSGVATLTGTIDSQKKKTLATRTALKVGGVKQVNNQLVVRDPKASRQAARPSSPTAAVKSQSPRLFRGWPKRGSQPKSKSLFTRKRVQLTSATTSSSGPRRVPVAVDPNLILAQRAAGAQRPAAPQGYGPLRTASHSDGPAMSPQSPAQAAAVHENQKVAEEIAKTLTSARLNGYDFEIRFKNGVAVLDGVVGDVEQRARATEVVSRMPAVQRVNNRLQVAAQPVAQGAGPRGVVPGQRGRQFAPTMLASGRHMSQMAYQPQPGQPMPPQPGPPMGPPVGSPMAATPPPPPGYGHPGQGAAHTVYNNPNLPNYAWPTYAQYPNSAQVTYPTQYSASAWPYIGPFYPYPQIPLGWRQVQLEWDDGYWSLNFNPRTDKWYWFMNPQNW